METVFADTKVRHGLGRAKYRGLEKFTAQALLSAMAYNLKKLLRHHWTVVSGAVALALPFRFSPSLNSSTPTSAIRPVEPSLR